MHGLRLAMWKCSLPCVEYPCNASNLTGTWGPWGRWFCGFHLFQHVGIIVQTKLFAIHGPDFWVCAPRATRLLKWDLFWRVRMIKYVCTSSDGFVGCVCCSLLPGQPKMKEKHGNTSRNRRWSEWSLGCAVFYWSAMEGWASTARLA